MRNDDETRTGLESAPGPGRPFGVRAGLRGLLFAVLGLLTAGTCWAVAALASIWLVPPYLVLMIVILYAPPGRPRDASGRADSAETDAPEPALPAGRGSASAASPEPGAGGSSAPAAPGADDPSSGAVPPPASTPSRKRSGKGRARKARPSIPVEAAWVQVGPGKFVRVETPSPASEPGPILRPGEPGGAEVPEPAAVVAAETWFTPPVVGESAPEPDCSGPGVPAADGIAPQAEDAWSESPGPDAAETLDVAEPGPDPDALVDSEPDVDDATMADLFLPRPAEPVEEFAAEPTPRPAPVDEAETPVADAGPAWIEPADPDPAPADADGGTIPALMDEPAPEPEEDADVLLEPLAAEVEPVSVAEDAAGSDDEPAPEDFRGGCERIRLRPRSLARGEPGRPHRHDASPGRVGPAGRPWARPVRPFDGRRRSRRGVGRSRMDARSNPPRSPPCGRSFGG